MMVIWNPKDKGAIEATELDVGNLGTAVDMDQFETEVYTGPSYNCFVSAWR